jgi:Family of unknown function (DUF6152)
MKANLAIVLAMLTVGAAAPAFAHHSFAAEFDANKPVSLKGTVSKVEFMNPHVWIYLDVKDESGKVAHWQCEGGAPNGLRRQGWSSSSLKEGEQISIEGFRAKDSSNTCNARTVLLPDGRKVFAGNAAEDGGPGAKKE